MDWEAVQQSIQGPASLVMAPFNDDLSLNLGALENNLRYIVDGGLRKGSGFLIVPCGTGEYLALEPDEHRQMVETAIKVTDGVLPVVAGVASCNWKDAIRLAENARRAGAQCVMIPPPYYYRLDDDALVEWFRVIAEAVDIGILVYDQVWRVGLGTSVSLAAMERLAQIPNVVGLKYGSPAQYMDMIDALDRFADRFAFIDNSLGYVSTVGFMHGASGFISGPSSWWPTFELHYWDLLKEGKYAEADRWHARLSPYMEFHRDEEFGGESYFYAAALLKACLEHVGLYGGPVRPPFRALTQRQKDMVFAVLQQIGAPSHAAVR